MMEHADNDRSVCLIPWDVEAATDQRILVSVNGWEQDRLTVVPYAQALLDVGHIQALTSTTIGGVRRSPSAWSVVVDHWKNDDLDRQYDDEGSKRDVETLPDDFAYSITEWLGEDSYYLWLPLARLRTFETCPRSILDSFGRTDNEVGLDYEAVPFLDPIDQSAIEAALTASGYHIVHDEALAIGYDRSNY